MARTISDIQVQIQSELAKNLTSIGITIDITKWSKRNIMRLFCFVFAVCAAFIEQLMDSLKVSIETIAAQAAAASPLWVQAKMFAFQYSDTNPQILQLIDTVPQYPINDPTLNIITACSVNTTIANQVIIKVAKQNPFVALTDNELSAAQGYINLIGTAGINYLVKTGNSDKLYINANIYYQGQYSGVIKDDVINAIKNFLQTLSVNNFNGSVKMSDLESVIRNVTGVNDVTLVNVRGRADSALFANGIDLIQNQQVKQRLWETIAGYVGEETTTGYTFTDTLNFIAE